MPARARWTLGVAALVVAIFVGTAWLGRWDGARPSGSIREAIDTTAPTAADPKHAAEVASAIEPARVEVAQPEPTFDRDRELRVIVLAPDLTPVVGAAVAVFANELGEWSFPDLAPDEPEDAELRAFSDRLGCATFSLEPLRRYDIVVDAKGFARARVESCHAGERVEVRLERGSRVFGRVVRAADRSAVRGAIVELWPRAADRVPSNSRGSSVVSDSEGRFEFAQVVAGRYALRVVADDLGWAHDEFDVAVGTDVEREIALDPGVAVRGSVTAATTGTPIAGAEVSDDSLFGRTVRTDAQGAFELRGLVPRNTRWLYARADGFARAELELRAGPREPLLTDVEIRMRRARSAIGRTLDSVGRPIAGVYVAAIANPWGSTVTDLVSTRSRDDGTFELAGLRPDARHVLWLRRHGAAAAARPFPEREFDDTRVELGDFVLANSASASGRLVDAEGRPVARREVSCAELEIDIQPYRTTNRADSDADGEHWAVLEMLRTRRTRTDDLGRFAFGDLAAGKYALRSLGRGGLQDARLEIVLAEGEALTGLELELTRGFDIAGSVRDGDGAPADALVDATPNGGTTPIRARTDSDGRFALRGLQRGGYRVRAVPLAAPTDDRGRPKWLPDTLEDVPAGTLDLWLRLKRGAELAGWILDALDAPRRDCEVRAFDRAGRELAQASSDHQGHFEFWLADDGLTSVSALCAGLDEVRVDDVRAGGEPVVLRAP